MSNAMMVNSITTACILTVMIVNGFGVTTAPFWLVAALLMLNTMAFLHVSVRSPSSSN